MSVKAVLDERKTTHGPYEVHAQITQDLKYTMQECRGYHTLPHYHRETLDMIAHKIGRILAGDPDFRDHWIDIAGYAELSANRCTK